MPLNTALISPLPNVLLCHTVVNIKLSLSAIAFLFHLHYLQSLLWSSSDFTANTRVLGWLKYLQCWCFPPIFICCRKGWNDPIINATSFCSDNTLYHCHHSALCFCLCVLLARTERSILLLQWNFTVWTSTGLLLNFFQDQHTRRNRWYLTHLCFNFCKLRPRSALSGT